MASESRRSIADLQDIVRQVRSRGASLKATEQPIDTSTAAGKCFLDILGVFAEFETNLSKERQLEGIAKAKAAGVYSGRRASVDAARVREMRAKGFWGLPLSPSRSASAGRASIGCWRPAIDGRPRRSTNSRKIDNPIVDSVLRGLLGGHAFSYACLNCWRRSATRYITTCCGTAYAPQSGASGACRRQ